MSSQSEEEESQSTIFYGSDSSSDESMNNSPVVTSQPTTGLTYEEAIENILNELEEDITGSSETLLITEEFVDDVTSIITDAGRRGSIIHSFSRHDMMKRASYQFIWERKSGETGEYTPHMKLKPEKFNLQINCLMFLNILSVNDKKIYSKFTGKKLFDLLICYLSSGLISFIRPALQLLENTLSTGRIILSETTGLLMIRCLETIYQLRHEISPLNIMTSMEGLLFNTVSPPMNFFNRGILLFEKGIKHEETTFVREVLRIISRLPLESQAIRHCLGQREILPLFIDILKKRDFISRLHILRICKGYIRTRIDAQFVLTHITFEEVRVLLNMDNQTKKGTIELLCQLTILGKYFLEKLIQLNLLKRILQEASLNTSETLDSCLQLFNIYAINGSRSQVNHLINNKLTTIMKNNLIYTYDSAREINSELIINVLHKIDSEGVYNISVVERYAAFYIDYPHERLEEKPQNLCKIGSNQIPFELMVKIFNYILAPNNLIQTIKLRSVDKAFKHFFESFYTDSKRLTICNGWFPAPRKPLSDQKIKVVGKIAPRIEFVRIIYTRTEISNFKVLKQIYRNLSALDLTNSWLNWRTCSFISVNFEKTLTLSLHKRRSSH